MKENSQYSVALSSSPKLLFCMTEQFSSKMELDLSEIE
jgi:hypothetical protein